VRVVVLVVGLVLAAVSLWSVSVGALLEVRRERTRDLDALCRAWVPLAGGDRLYRCGAPTAGGGDWCPTHASPSRRNAATTHPHAERVEATRQWADARRKMRWGIPVATLSLVAVVVGLALWT
jgi:hypothetical protein